MRESSSPKYYIFQCLPKNLYLTRHNDSSVMKLFPLYLLQVATIPLSGILYMVSWKKEVVMKNTSLCENLTHHSNSNLFYFSLLHNMMYDLACFFWFKLAPVYFQPNIEISDSSRNQLRQIRMNQDLHIPTIIYSVHYGNFEWMAHFLQQNDIALVASVHPLHQNLPSRVLQFLRQFNKTPYTLDLKNNFDSIRKIFSNGQILGWMVDQRPIRKTNCIHPFLTQSACWNPIPQYLESKFKTKQFSCLLIRTSWVKFELKVERLNKTYPSSIEHLEYFIYKRPHLYYGLTHKRFSHEHPYSKTYSH